LKLDEIGVTSFRGLGSSALIKGMVFVSTTNFYYNKFEKGVVNQIEDRNLLSIQHYYYYAHRN